MTIRDGRCVCPWGNAALLQRWHRHRYRRMRSASRVGTSVIERHARYCCSGTRRWGRVRHRHSSGQRRCRCRCRWRWLGRCLKSHLQCIRHQVSEIHDRSWSLWIVRPRKLDDFDDAMLDRMLDRLGSCRPIRQVATWHRRLVQALSRASRNVHFVHSTAMMPQHMREECCALERAQIRSCLRRTRRACREWSESPRRLDGRRRGSN